VLVELLALVHSRQARGKQVHDANIVATTEGSLEGEPREVQGRCAPGRRL
jgi:hypothetical protein